MYKARYRHILRFFGRIVFSFVVWDVVLPKVGLRALGRRTRSRRMQKTAVAFRRLAARMGGVLIKVGQFLSARLDVLPREITAELAGLQDEVGAERYEDIRAVIEAEFSLPLAEKFVDFDPVPMASASIGQVHCARLCLSSPQGEPCPSVVVKVQRPHIREIVDADLAAIRVVGGWLMRFDFIRKHANIHGLIEEFSRTLYEEIDYIHEGKNAEIFARNFKDREDIRVPDVIWSHTTRRVLTLQDVGAIKITDYPGIEAAGISRAEVANRLLDVYLQQVFEDGFFHADPHPGNLFVLPAPTPANPGAWRLVFVDFGMTGTLAADTFSGLREALIAVGTRDAVGLVEAYQRLHLLLPGADLDLIERANRRVFDRIWGKSTKDVMEMDISEMRAFVQEFGELLYEMPFQIPESFIMLGRCVAILSGMAMGLDPEFNVWTALAPYAQKLIAEDGAGRIQLIMKEASRIVGVLAALPRHVDSLISRIEQGRLDVRLPEMRQSVVRLEHGFRKLAGSIIFSAILMCASAFFIAGRTDFAIPMGAVDACLLLWILFGR